MVSDLGSPPRRCQNEIFKSAKEQIEELQLITPLARLCGFRRLEVDSWRHLRIQKQLGEAWVKVRFASCGHGNFCSSCRRFHAWDSRFRNVSLDRDKAGSGSLQTILRSNGDTNSKKHDGTVRLAGFVSGPHGLGKACILDALLHRPGS